MIQIEVAGPRTPQSVELIPNQIRDMAERVLETCTQGTDLYGGFVTSDMTAMKDWITSAETDLDGYYRKQHTASWFILRILPHHMSLTRFCS